MEADGTHVPAVPIDAASFSARGGSTVVPLVDGNPTFTRLEELMAKAKTSIWITVCFLDVQRWRSPSGLPFFEMLAQHGRRGIDVRVLVWRLEYDNPVLHHPRSTFFTVPPGFALPRSVTIRWDSSGPDHRHCHHEKTWVIDGDTATPVAVQGGIVLNWGSLASPGHPAAEIRAGHRTHDVNVEVRGTAAGDVATHFVERWNVAHLHREPGRHWPTLELAGPLPTPPHPAPCGDGRAQVLRTMRPGWKHDEKDSAGESSILEAYRAAITSARQTIYIEQQHIAHPELLGLLEQACDRGVRVLYLVPSDPCVLRARMPWWAAKTLEVVLSTGFLGGVAGTTLSAVAAAMRWLFPTSPATALNGELITMPSPNCDASFLEIVPRLCTHPNFTLAGLVSTGMPVYVHSKLMIVDDSFLLVGSANLVDLSLAPDHTELAVAAWGDPAIAMRDALYSEHAGCDELPVEVRNSGRATLEWVRTLAQRNAQRRHTARPIQGNIFQLDGRLYGNVLFLVNAFLMETRSRGAERHPLTSSKI